MHRDRIQYPLVWVFFSLAVPLSSKLIKFGILFDTVNSKNMIQWNSLPVKIAKQQQTKQNCLKIHLLLPGDSAF